MEVMEELLESSKPATEIIESHVDVIELPFERNKSPFHRGSCFFVLPGSQAANEMVLLGVVWGARELRDACLVACVAKKNII